MRALEKRSRLVAALGNKIQGERYAHSLRVAETAGQLARRFGANVEAADAVGLMHDYAKQYTPAELFALGTRYELVKDPAEVAAPDLLHGPVAAILLAEAGLITEPDQLAAIREHTTGAAEMSLLSQVLWVADYIEPGRRFPGVDEVRALADHDLRAALRLALEQTIRHCLDRGWLLHAKTVQARNWLISMQTG